MRDATRNALLAAGVGAAALGSYAFLVEPRWLQVTRTRIHVAELPQALEGLTIALLTDLHGGDGTPLSLIRRACELAVREAPALIALTGDLIADDAESFQPVLRELEMLHAPLGVYAVPGNHDHTVGIETWRREVGQQKRIQDITNHAVVHRIGSARLCVAGVDDLTCGDPSLSALPPPEERDVTVLLAHDPEQAERARRSYDRIDLILSGHTHGGQVRLPVMGALVNPVEREDLYEFGLRRRPWTQVYVSRGVGTVGIPVRFLCRPEVALLELTGAPRPGRFQRERRRGRDAE